MELGRDTLAELEPDVRSYINELEQSNHALELQYEILEEEHRLLLLKRFARSSEQESSDQSQLFDETEDTSDAPTGIEEKITVGEHTKKGSSHKSVHDIRQREIAETMVEISNVGRRGTKSIGFVDDEFGLVVQSLDRSVVDRHSKIVHDVVLVSP